MSYNDPYNEYITDYNSNIISGIINNYIRIDYIIYHS